MTRAALLAAAADTSLPAMDRAQYLWAARELAQFDGTEYDLALTWIDARGCPWKWAGRWAADEMPIMRSAVDEILPLDEVYANWAPLLPAPRPLLAADVRAALRGAA
ncbi:phiSA1p31-related protein [Streptomyces kronopolitis]|uniref:phiSA1p31-related protein n=1 Tax=Streptomyces kronopolitis TaxID=1612435 RepID=UPI003415AD27